MEGYAPRMNTALDDQHFLNHAIRIAARGLGRTAPNPSVGCVLVKEGQVIAAARTADGGRPHAEALALAAVGNAARGATAYVSLEPCAHHGQTPPCAEALIAAGVARVVIGAVDPDPRVSGRGMAMLRAAGMIVDIVPTSQAAHNLRGFFRRVQHGLPEVTLKLATSADGFLASTTPEARWITGETARLHGHRLRSRMEAIVTGIGTVLADDPLLNVRLPGMAHAKLLRVICDRQLRLPLESKLVRTAEMQPVLVLTTAEGVEHAASHATELRERGVMLHVTAEDTLTPQVVLRTLAREGYGRVMIEAGAALSAAFLQQNCVDSLYWYRAPLALGNAGILPVPALEPALSQATRLSVQPLGVDTLEIYGLTSCLPD